MILMAAWRSCTVKYRGQPVALKRGQLVISQRDLAQLCGRPKMWAEHLIKRLIKAEMVTIQQRKTEASAEATPRHHGRALAPIITICNYSLYQAETTKAEASAKGITEASAEPMNKEGLEETPISPRKRGHDDGRFPIPRNWKPPAVVALSPKAQAVASHWTAERYEHEAEQFHQYWHGQGSRKADWRAAWASRILSLDGANASDHARRGSHTRTREAVAGSVIRPGEVLPWERDEADLAQSGGGNSS